MRFNPAPGWPQTPPGWFPPAGWTPPAHWPPAPQGWPVFLVADPSEARSGRAPVHTPPPVTHAHAGTGRVEHQAPASAQPNPNPVTYDGPGETEAAPTSTPGTALTPRTASRRGRADAKVALVVAVAVFLACSVIQGACGSSMFTDTYDGSTGMVQGLLLQITFFPGWAFTVFLVIRAVVRFSMTD
jgi:hypothetical protein